MRWIIGDIHGMLIPLEALLREVWQRDADAQFFFTGDYVNRGPDSRAAVDLLISLPDASFARGNHDDIFDLVLNQKSMASGTDPLPAFNWFLAHGLDRTLLSYSIDQEMLEHVARRPTPERIEDLVNHVPQSHRDFFRHLRPVIETESDFFVIHAKWSTEDPDGTPKFDRASETIRHRMLWERFSDRELARQKHWRRRGFFGHTPVMNYSKMDENLPIVGNGVVLLDTGRALSVAGRLTAFCADTDEYIQVDRDGVRIT